eukprot:4461501-Heterocapsa_arctica.AAC.1
MGCGFCTRWLSLPTTKMGSDHVLPSSAERFTTISWAAASLHSLAPPPCRASVKASSTPPAVRTAAGMRQQGTPCSPFWKTST